ncbi:MAG: M43 family zinc metalloprotease [Bacteroidota bacterium]
MKKLFTFILKVSLMILFTIPAMKLTAQDTLIVFKTMDPDMFTYRYNYVDSLCDPEMYGTLQWAIRKANDSPNPCVIIFAIPGSGQQIIYLNYDLPVITKQVIIDGTTQPDYLYGMPSVVIDGQNKISTCLYIYNKLISSLSPIVKGLQIQNFTMHGIIICRCTDGGISNNVINRIQNGPSDVPTFGIMIMNSYNVPIKGNFIGTDFSHNSGIGNDDFGIGIPSVSSAPLTSNIIIGGSGINEGNTIACNGTCGILIGMPNYNNKISRNLIFNNPVGIRLPDSGQHPAPVIMSYVNDMLSGTSAPDDIIEIFGSTGSENANEYLTTVTADINGNWTANVSTTFNYFVATATDVLNNTSQFSNAVMAEMPTSQLIDEDCNKYSVFRGDTLNTELISGATEYEFNIFNADNSYSTTFFSYTGGLPLLDIPDLKFGVNYFVAVRTIFNNDTSLFGDTCEFAFLIPSGTQLLIERALNKPEVVNQINEFENIIQQIINQGNFKSSTNYTIPVVFHVISPTSVNPSLWVTTTRIEEQLQVLNDAFAGNFNSGNFDPPNNTNIRFCLAVNDDDENPIASTTYYGTPSGHDGITYESHDDFTNNNMGGQVPFGQQALMDRYANNFPPDKYLNVYIVDNIIDGSSTSMICGYSPMPEIQNPNDPMNGVVIDMEAFGSNYFSNPNTITNTDILNAGYDHGLTLVHEVGHYINLWHVFQGGCSGTDYCNDTYPQLVNSSGCVVGQQSCGTVDNIHNFMDYSSDHCRNTYSLDQIDRFHICIDYLKTDLVSIPNLSSTGLIITNGCIEPGLETAWFEAVETSICSPNNAIIDFGGLTPFSNFSFEFTFTNIASGITQVETPTASPLIVSLPIGLWSVTLYIIDNSTLNNVSLVESNYIYIDDCLQPLVIPTQAQWHFDDRLALDFTNWLPQQIPSPMIAWESESSISDNSGNLILFTNGYSVWDEVNNIANSITPDLLNGMNSPYSAKKGTVILQSPNPAENHLYYIFSIPGTESYSENNGLSYTIIDNNSKIIHEIGGIEQRNIPVAPGTGSSPNNNNIMVSEALAVIPDFNNTGYWIITNAGEQDDFSTGGPDETYNGNLLAYHFFNNSGVTQINGPVLSPFYPSLPSQYVEDVRSIEFSPDGRYVAIQRHSQYGYILYYFNNNTGHFKELLNIDSEIVTDISFDPSSRFLYYSGLNGVYQVDIETLDICNSYIEENNVTNDDWFSIQRGPNNKLYLGTPWFFNNSELGVINLPSEKVNNSSPYSCLYQDNALTYFTPGYASVWFPNFNDVTNLDLSPKFIFCSANCTNEFHFTSLSSGDSFLWNFGDGNTSTDEDPVHNYSNPNNDYNVVLTVFSGGTNIGSYSEIINPNLFNNPPSCNIYGPDIICEGSTTLSSYSTDHTNLEYEWDITNNTDIFSSSNATVEFIWDDTPSATHTIELTVIDPATGCSCSETLNLSIEPELDISLSDLIVQCSLPTIASATIEVSGFTSNYDLMWSDGTNTFFQNDITTSSYTISGLTSGIWGITAYNNQHCGSTLSDIVVIDYNNFEITDEVIINDCIGPIGTGIGEIYINVSGGIAPITYNWSGPATYSSTDEDISGIDAGNYTVIVTDANGCSIVESIVVDAVQVFSIVSGSLSIIDASCYGENDGEIHIEFTGGIPYMSGFFAYSIHPPGSLLQENGDFTELVADDYIVMVSDINSCINSINLTVQQPDEINISNIITSDVLCSGDNNGVIDISVTGGTQPYSFHWESTTGTGFIVDSEDQTGISAGTYTVSVTDNNNCPQDVETIIINEPPILSAAIPNTTIQCFGLSTTATVTPVGGTPGYSYQWDAAAGNQTSQTATGLTAGTYQVTVTDLNGCFTVASVTITENPVIILVIDDVSEDCNGPNLGSILITATGGTGILTYFWQTSTGSGLIPTNEDQDGLSQGYYDVTVTDAIGCTEILNNIEVSEYNWIVKLDPIYITCPDYCDGALLATVTPTNVIPPYPDFTYSWSEGTIIPTSAYLNTLSNVCQGNYSVTVTDDNGCTATNSLYMDMDPTLFNTMNLPNFSSPPATVTWTGQNYKFNHNIVIPENCTLEILGSSIIEFTQNHGITVQPGGDLIVDNSTVTNYQPCDQMWKGLAITDQFSSSYGDAKIIIRNNSTVSNALIGINCMGGPDLDIANSSFINNQTGIKISAWWYYDCDDIIIDRNQFTYNYSIYGLFDKYPNTHIALRDARRLKLRGNDFEYQISSFGVNLYGDKRGKGIYASNSSFEVTEYCTWASPLIPCPNPDRSNFDNLYYGIDARSNSYGTTVKLENCWFKNYGYIGANLKTYSAPVIITNKFYDTDIFTKSTGLYLQNCGAYHVENNTFDNICIGMLINNSHTIPNKVYRNHFSNMHNGFQSLYNNSDATGDQGLFIQCNDYESNNTYNYIRSGNVKKQQGFDHPTNNLLDISAANQFDAVYLDNPVIDEAAFKTYDSFYSFDYNYYYNKDDDHITDIRDHVSAFHPALQGNVFPQEIDYILDPSEACPSELPYLTAIEAEEELTLRSVEINDLNNILDNLIDGGNTAELLNKVGSIQPNKFNKVCNELLELSPYLSDTVLTAFMQTSVNGHVVAKTNVLLANSPLPPNARNELDNMLLPPPFKQLIEAEQQGTNAVIQKQEEISQLVFDREMVLNSVMRYGLGNDSVPEIIDSLITILENEQRYEAKYTLIPILINLGRYTDAEYQISELEYKASTLSAELQQEIAEYIDLQEILLEIDTIADTSMVNTIISNNLVFLENIAYNPKSLVCGQAQTLLEMAGLAVFEPEMYLPEDENKAMKVTNSENHNITTEVDFNDCIEVYPNPASDELWIEYIIFNDNTANRLEIFSLDGKSVLKQEIKNTYGIEQVNVSGLSDGNYILKLGKYKKQFNIVK